MQTYGASLWRLRISELISDHTRTTFDGSQGKLNRSPPRSIPSRPEDIQMTAIASGALPSLRRDVHST
jgi:hypothetical protein